MKPLKKLFGKSSDARPAANEKSSSKDVDEASIDADLKEFDQLAASTHDPVVKDLALQARNWFTLEKWPRTKKSIDPSFNFRELVFEGDRGCWLSACAFVDSLLKDSIRQKFILLSSPSKADLDSLLSADSPLGTFGARITTARVLGLIDDKTRNALRALKKIRNTGAHSWNAFHFSQTNVHEVAICFGKKHSDMVHGTGDVFDRIMSRLNPLYQSNPHKLAFIFLTALLIRRTNPG